MSVDAGLKRNQTKLDLENRGSNGNWHFKDMRQNKDVTQTLTKLRQNSNLEEQMKLNFRIMCQDKTGPQKG